jgi:alkylated DNA repair dioxygenase AlkB
MEGNKIDYHDDEESDLGPTIVTLSLGYPATMIFA